MGIEILHFPFEIQPEFQQGQAAMFRFLGNNIKYPRKARANGIEGTVYVGFVIEKDGTVTDISVKKGVQEELDNESMRVVGLMPKWTAGKLDGELVKIGRASCRERVCLAV